jgi:hypothetical protein
MWDIAHNEAKGVRSECVCVVNREGGRDKPSSEQTQKNTIFVALELDIFFQTSDICVCECLTI